MYSDRQFRLWIAEADRVVRRECDGLSILDFPEWQWVERYQGGEGPASAAYAFVDEEVNR